MTAEQWARVNALFHDVVERPPSDRARFLREATDDACVREEVEALVAAHSSDPAFLEAPAVDLPSGAADVHAGAARGQHGSDASMQTRVGRAIGPYRVTRELARGGMGIVYLAHDTRLGRDVAIKALPLDLAADPTRRERLRREARAAAALAHPGIATVFALEEQGDELFLVSEYITGRTLRDQLRDGPLPADRLLRVAIELAEATAAAHALGIVHRDLKPENVICTEKGSIKILDFGLARTVQPWAQALAPTLTADGTLVGTPAYMAPEQIRGTTLDQRTDVFALGIVLYELATGRHPFGNLSFGETLHQVLTAEPAPLGRSDLADAFEAIVRQCLEKDPARRYLDAAGLAAALGPVRASRMREAPNLEGPDLEGPDLEGTRREGHARRGPSNGAPRVAHAPRETPSGIATSVPSRDSASPARVHGSAWWWWAFHQASVAFFLAVVVAPAWMAWALVADPTLRGLLRVVLLIVVAAGVSVRLHLRFVARVHPGSLAAQRTRVRSWLATCDWGFVGVLTAGAFAIMAVHALFGGILVGLAVCYAVVFLQVEPATAKAAFGEELRK